MRKYVFYFIALVVTLIYGNIAHDMSDLTAGFMAAIPFGIIAGFVAWYLSGKDNFRLF